MVFFSVLSVTATGSASSYTTEFPDITQLYVRIINVISAHFGKEYSEAHLMFLNQPQSIAESRVRIEILRCYGQAVGFENSNGDTLSLCWGTSLRNILEIKGNNWDFQLSQGKELFTVLDQSIVDFTNRKEDTYSEVIDHMYRFCQYDEMLPQLFIGLSKNAIDKQKLTVNNRNNLSILAKIARQKLEAVVFNKNVNMTSQEYREASQMLDSLHKVMK